MIIGGTIQKRINHGEVPPEDMEKYRKYVTAIFDGKGTWAIEECVKTVHYRHVKDG